MIADNVVTRTLVTTHEWTMPDGVALGEFSKAETAAVQAWERLYPGKPMYDDSICVRGDGESIVISFTEEHPT